MKAYPLKQILVFGLILISGNLLAATPDMNGRWRMDPALSSALDGWQKMDLIIAVDGPQVAVTYAMQWRKTQREATNVYDTAGPVKSDDYFRIEQRHMAVYPAKEGTTTATAEWLDHGRTLRVEATSLVEVSQGDVAMRIFQEFRVSELGDRLTLIELHSTRNRPLVYVFAKITNEEAAQ